MNQAAAVAASIVESIQKQFSARVSIYPVCIIFDLWHNASRNFSINPCSD